MERLRRGDDDAAGFPVVRPFLRGEGRSSASVSPYILEQFEKEAGYRFRPEFIIDQGYYRVLTSSSSPLMPFIRGMASGPPLAVWKAVMI